MVRKGLRKASAARMLGVSVNTLDKWIRRGTLAGLLAAAISELERDDPDYQKSFTNLYGTSLQAIKQHRLKPVVIPKTFGPED